MKVRSPKDKVEPHSRVIGYHAAGIVDAVGPYATLFKVGDDPGEIFDERFQVAAFPGRGDLVGSSLVLPLRGGAIAILP